MLHSLDKHGGTRGEITIHGHETCGNQTAETMKTIQGNNSYLTIPLKRPLEYQLIHRNGK